MIKFSGVPKIGIIIGIVLILSFLYVWQRIQIFRLGYKIRSTEKKLGEIVEKNTVLAMRISSLESPQNIKKELDRLGLDLAPPKEKQIVRIR